MISLKVCDNCSLEYDEILPDCPHCYSGQIEASQGDEKSSYTDRKIFHDNREASKDFRLTISGDAVQVDLETAKLHPNFGLTGELLYFRFALIFSPLLGMIYTLSQYPILFKTNSFWIIYSCIFDGVLFVWAYWLSGQLFKFQRKTIDYIYKYLIVSAIIGIATAYMCSNLNNSVFVGPSPLILVHFLKLTCFSIIVGFYVKISEKIKITYLHIIKKNDPFFSAHNINVSTLPNDTAWLDHANGFSDMTKNTLASNHKTLANFSGRSTTEQLPNVQSAGLETVENFSLRIAALKNALNQELITENDYKKKKKQILDEL